MSVKVKLVLQGGKVGGEPEQVELVDPSLEDLEEAYVSSVMRVAGGKAPAAKVLGIDRRTVYRKLARKRSTQ